MAAKKKIESLDEDRIDTLEGLVNTLAERVNALESREQGSISIRTEAKAAELPSTVFSESGKDYKFNTIAFVINTGTETRRVTADEALKNDELLSHIVENYPDLLDRV